MHKTTKNNENDSLETLMQEWYLDTELATYSDEIDVAFDDIMTESEA